MASRGVGDSFGGYRARLVETLQANGIKDMAVLAAFAATPRHVFVPLALRDRAYEDTSLPIGKRQTISQPTTHARFLEALALSGTERVLEVGTGSGYQTALLSFLADQVVSVERIGSLATGAREALREAGCRNVSVVVGDGTLGWRSMAPYDAILVGAVGDRIPDALTEQLADGGTLVMPVRRGDEQVVVRVTKRGVRLDEEVLGGARFVPLVDGRSDGPAST